MYAPLLPAYLVLTFLQKGFHEPCFRRGRGGEAWRRKGTPRNGGMFIMSRSLLCIRCTDPKGYSWEFGDHVGGPGADS